MLHRALSGGGGGRSCRHLEEDDPSISDQLQRNQWTLATHMAGSSFIESVAPFWVNLKEKHMEKQAPSREFLEKDTHKHPCVEEIPFGCFSVASPLQSEGVYPGLLQIWNPLRKWTGFLWFAFTPETKKLRSYDMEASHLYTERFDQFDISSL